MRELAGCKQGIIALLLLTATMSGIALAVEMDDEARNLAKQYGSTLKRQLISIMQAAGPVQAIEFCNLSAPDIAAAIATESNWQVGRTSLKTRSEANNPDVWEQTVLQEFEAKKLAGADLATLEYSEVVEVDGTKSFRYMKAIPTEVACLQCHGSTIAPAVDAKLQLLYPTDRARGFSEGDIRGAFTLQKPL